MEFVTKWREYICHVAVDLCMGDSDALEGGVQGSVINGCQGGDWEFGMVDLSAVMMGTMKTQ